VHHNSLVLVKRQRKCGVQNKCRYLQQIDKYDTLSIRLTRAEAESREQHLAGWPGCVGLRRLVARLPTGVARRARCRLRLSLRTVPRDACGTGEVTNGPGWGDDVVIVGKEALNSSSDTLGRPEGCVVYGIAIVKQIPIASQWSCALQCYTLLPAREYSSSHMCTQVCGHAAVLKE
jgi:hypothetical protein